MLNIGQNIAILRLRKKLTQEDLADKGNVSAQTIADFENGVTQPDVETLAEIAKNTIHHLRCPHHRIMVWKRISR